MSKHPAGKGPQSGRAQHGAPSEVTWNSGAGRQPYANQDEGADKAPGTHEYSGGDRGELSGRNLEQLEEVKKRP
jgi:hypothetical protein